MLATGAAVRSATARNAALPFSEHVVGDHRRLASSLDWLEREYCLKCIEFKGDRKQALRAVGKRGNPDQFEARNPAIAVFRGQLERAAAEAAGITGAMVLARVDRLAETAESEGKLQAAVQANRLLMQGMGMLSERRDGLIVNGDGNVIQIVHQGARSVQEEDSGSGEDAIDAEYREILELNGRA